MYTTEDNPLTVEERRAHILWICDAENEDVFIVGEEVLSKRNKGFPYSWAISTYTK